MSTGRAALMTLTYAWVLGMFYNFILHNSYVMTILLCAVGLVCFYYVVVECVAQYRLMKELTEGPDLAPPTEG